MERWLQPAVPLASAGFLAPRCNLLPNGTQALVGLTTGFSRCLALEGRNFIAMVCSEAKPLVLYKQTTFLALYGRHLTHYTYPVSLFHYGVITGALWAFVGNAPAMTPLCKNAWRRVAFQCYFFHVALESSATWGRVTFQCYFFHEALESSATWGRVAFQCYFFHEALESSAT